MYRALALALALAAPSAALSAFAQDLGGPVDRPKAAFNLGPLGARAKIVSGPGGKGLALELTEIDGGSPLDETRPKLEQGDQIVAVDRQPLAGKQDALYQLARAIRTRLAGRGKKMPLPLTVQRGTRSFQVTAVLQGRGRNWSAVLRAESFKHITKLMDAEDGFKTDFNSKVSKVAAASMVGLAAFAAGGGPRGAHSTLLRGIRNFVAANAGQERSGRGGANASQLNWSLGFATLFLSEYVAQKGKDSGAVKVLQKLCEQIAQSQETNGGWAHGPGGPNSLGYTDLSAVTVLVLAGYGGSKRVGVKVRDDVMEKGLRYLMETSGASGTIGYSARGGQKGMDGCGRTSAGLIAFLACGKAKDPFVQKMRDYIVPQLVMLPEEHASPMYQIAFGGLGASLCKGGSKEFLKLYELELLLAIKHDGTFYPRPSKENVKADYMMGPAWPTGAYLLAWSAVTARRPTFKILR